MLNSSHIMTNFFYFIVTSNIYEFTNTIRIEQVSYFFAYYVCASSGTYRLHGNIVNYQNNCHSLPYSDTFCKHIVLNTPEITNLERMIVCLCLNTTNLWDVYWNKITFFKHKICFLNSLQNMCHLCGGMFYHLSNIHNFCYSFSHKSQTCILRRTNKHSQIIMRLNHLIL